MILFRSQIIKINKITFMAELVMIHWCQQHNLLCYMVGVEMIPFM